MLVEDTRHPERHSILFERRSPLSPPSNPSLLYLTLWISLGVPGCGEHLRNWLLARLVSLLLTPPLLLLVTSISLLPLLFYMLLCEPLWVYLTVENLFTINLGVLSSRLYGWRSLEATVSIRLKARCRRLKSKTKTPENSWLKGTLTEKSWSKSLHSYTETKFHPRANTFQSKTYQANSPTKIGT